MSEDQNAWFERVKSLSERHGYASDMKAYKADPSAYKGSVADVSSFIRLAVTGRLNSPDLYEVISIMGEERVKTRLNTFAESL